MIKFEKCNINEKQFISLLKSNTNVLIENCKIDIQGKYEQIYTEKGGKVIEMLGIDFYGKGVCIHIKDSDINAPNTEVPCKSI